LPHGQQWRGLREAGRRSGHRRVVPRVCKGQWALQQRSLYARLRPWCQRQGQVQWRGTLMAQFTLVGAQAVRLLARLASRNAVKAQLRRQGVRVSHVRYADIIAQANAYLDAHPELYQQALERAQRMGYIDPMTMER